MKNNLLKKVTVLVLSIFIFCGIFLTGCGSTPEQITVDSIQISKKNVYLAEGQTTVLSAQVFPFNANNQNIVWTSSDESVVKVEDGFVTAVKKGEATIEVISEEGGYKDTCNVLVTTASDNLALNNYNNLNMPPKELKPIYNGQNINKSSTNNKNRASNKTTARQILNNMVSKASAEVDDAKQSAKNVVEDIKTELKTSIDNLNQQKEYLAQSVNSTKNSFTDMFNNIQSQMIDSMKNIKQQMLNNLEQTEEKIDNEEYTVQKQNVNGVTFVVISNNTQND